MKNDSKITKFGKFLRKISLDEFLQIWDILCGRILVVGPRPPIMTDVLPPPISATLNYNINQNY